MRIPHSLLSFAAGAEAFPFRMIRRNDETIVEDGRTGNTVARFPEKVQNIITHHNTYTWAGYAANHLHLFTLESM